MERNMYVFLVLHTFLVVPYFQKTAIYLLRALFISDLNGCIVKIGFQYRKYNFVFTSAFILVYLVMDTFAPKYLFSKVQYCVGF